MIYVFPMSLKAQVIENGDCKYEFHGVNMNSFVNEIAKIYSQFPNEDIVFMSIENEYIGGIADKVLQSIKTQYASIRQPQIIFKEN